MGNGLQMLCYKLQWNYTANNKVNAARLPRDPAEGNRWIAIIRRDNIPNKQDTVVYERHWPADYETVCDYGKLQPCHPPSVFDYVKLSLIPTVASAPRTTKEV